MGSDADTRLIEILVTHNEPVLIEDLVCALGISRAGVQALAVRLQTLGYAALYEDQGTVAATPAAEAVLRGGAPDL
jgi:DNA-binding IclR family transcriptional regulator